ncbi:IclR family transcriptional regulator C-terminal domain-containing protein, partial [Clostridium tertium]|uniref:IclR family transcriptional regulator domain-containing protein n=1 Tax=Clostridium tertium TaxID=1559 RepID=UPI00325B5A3E
NYVDKPCTYACRGGIIDIFSLEYDYPIRIEFFDTEIESIRFFNEQTQRTIRSIDSVEIGPATDILLTNQQIETIKEAVFEKLEKELIEAKTNGYAIEKSEINDYTSCISIPLLKDSKAIASLSVSIPTFRFSDEKFELI